MKLSGKKLTTAILAGLMGATMFGGSVFAEDTNQQILELQQNVHANTTRISQLENAQSAAKDYSKDIAANKTAITDETTARTEADKKLQSSVDANAKAIDAEVTARDQAVAQERADRKGADAAQDKVIKQVNDNLVSSVDTINKNIGTITDQLNKNDLAEAQTRAAADKTLQDNIDAEATARDQAVAQERAERKGADAAQDKVIKQVNDNLVSSVNTINKNIGTITDQLNKNDLAEAQARDAADQTLQKNIDAEATARDAADQKLQGNIDAEAKARQTDVANLQKNITDSLTNQDKINQTLTTAVQNNSKVMVESAKNLEKHLSDTDGRVDKANAEIHTNAGNIAQSKQDIADIQDTLKKADALASKAATEAATQAASAATKAADNANNVANGLNGRLNVISSNQTVTSESDLIKQKLSIGENLTNVDAALHKEIAARIGADKAQDKVIEQVNKNVVDGFNNINQNVAAGFTALNQADANEAAERKDADSQLNTKMTNGFATIQGQQDAQDAKIGKNHTDIQTNAGNIQENKDAIKVNSDKLTNHEDRITTNESNIERNAESIKKETNARIDADQQEASERKDADSQLNTKMTNGFATIQGQQDAQDAKIGKNHTDIQTNAGNIKNNQDAIKANSDRLDNHEGRIAGNETNIATNATNISKEISARQDADTALQKNIDAEAKARADKDTAHDTAIAANKKAIGDEAAARQADISRLDNKIHDVSKEVDTVGALSMAMSGLHPLSYDEGDARFQLSAAVGTYDGTEALALGGFYHFNRDSMLSVGVATDLGADEHRMGANVGYTRRIGQGGHVSRPSEGTVSDIMKDIKNLEQKQAKLEQENEQLKQQLAALKK